MFEELIRKFSVLAALLYVTYSLNLIAIVKGNVICHAAYKCSFSSIDSSDFQFSPVHEVVFIASDLFAQLKIYV